MRKRLLIYTKYIMYLQRTLISNNYAAFATKSFTTWKDLSVVTEIEIVKHAMNFS